MKELSEWKVVEIREEISAFLRGKREEYLSWLTEKCKGDSYDDVDFNDWSFAEDFLEWLNYHG